MQLIGLVHTGNIPTVLSTRSWTIAGADYRKESIAKHGIARRSAQAPTTVETGLRREEVGGIVIGVCAVVALLMVLFYCCHRRRRSWSSDTESDGSAPPAQPPRPPQAPTHPTSPPEKPPQAPTHPTSPPEKPPPAPARPAKKLRTPAIIPTLADNAYDESRHKSVTRNKNGQIYVEGHTGEATDKPRPVAHVRWPKPMSHKLKSEGINQLQD